MREWGDKPITWIRHMEASASIKDLLGPPSTKDELQRVESKDRLCHLHLQLQPLQHQDSTSEVLYYDWRRSQLAGFKRYLEHGDLRPFGLFEVVHHPQYRGVYSCNSWQLWRW